MFVSGFLYFNYIFFFLKTPCVYLHPIYHVEDILIKVSNERKNYRPSISSLLQFLDHINQELGLWVMGYVFILLVFIGRSCYAMLCPLPRAMSMSMSMPYLCLCLCRIYAVSIFIPIFPHISCISCISRKNICHQNNQKTPAQFPALVYQPYHMRNL